MSLLAVSPGDKFCVSRKGLTGGGGWVHPNGANSMAVSGLKLGSRRPWLAPGGPFCPFWHRNEPSHLVGPPFSAFKACFSAAPGWHLARLKVVGVVTVRYLLRMAEMKSGISFKPSS